MTTPDYDVKRSDSICNNGPSQNVVIDGTSHGDAGGIQNCCPGPRGSEGGSEKPRDSKVPQELGNISNDNVDCEDHPQITI